MTAVTDAIVRPLVTDVEGWPRCGCCGITAKERRVTIRGSSHRDSEALCATCDSLLDGGLLRREVIEDDAGIPRMRYRQWVPQTSWTPGDLVPMVSEKIAG